VSEDQKVSPGDRFRPNAALQNTLVDVANAYRAGLLPSGPSEGSDLSAASPVTVRIKNSTGSLLPRGSVLGISNTLRAASSAEWKNAIELIGTTPAAGHEGKFAILQTHAPATSGIAEATLAGAAQVDINVQSSTHKYAEIEAGRTDRLISVASGSAQILWVAGTSGVQPGVVRLLSPRPESGVFTATGETTGAYALRDGDSALTSAPSIGWSGSAANWKNVKAYPSLRGQGSNVGLTVFSNSAGAVFNVILSPTAFTDPWVTVKQDGKYRVMATGTYTLGSVTAGDADAYLRAAQHRHGYGAGLYTGYETPQALSLQTYYHEMWLNVAVNFRLASPGTYSSRNSIQYYYSAHTVYANVTVIAYFVRSGSDITVDLVWEAYGPGTSSALAESRHVKTQVTIERTGDL